MWINNSKKCIVWYNNGIDEIQIDLNTNYTIPNNFIKGRIKTRLKSAKKIQVTDVTTQTIQTFTNMVLAEKFLQISRPTLITACKTNKLIKNKYICAYIV